MNQDIVKSNALIEAVYNPGSVYQMRLLMAALMQVKAKESLDYKHRYYVTANALADMTGTKAVDNYKELKKASIDLMNTTVIIKDEPNNGQNLKRELMINLVSSCEYMDNEGRVGLRFTEEILPYVADLKRRFTQYQAKYVMPMKSSYGIRLYELCLQWMGEEREFEVEEFRHMFGLGKGYERIDNLKNRVIEPALKDINTYSDIRVKFGQRKTGRKVSHFQFMIVKPTKKEKPLAIRDWITKHEKARPGESWDEATKRLRSEHNQYKKNG
jgi:plasmid replication initiation protein